MRPKKQSPAPAATSMFPYSEKVMTQLLSKAGGRALVQRHGDKTSQALWHLASPLLKKAVRREQVEQTLRTTIVAWNLAIVPEQHRKKMLDEQLQPTLWVFRWMIKRMIRAQITRKLKLYPEDRHYIADVAISGDAPDFKIKLTTTGNIITK